MLKCIEVDYYVKFFFTNYKLYIKLSSICSYLKSYILLPLDFFHTIEILNQSDPLNDILQFTNVFRGPTCLILWL